MEILQASKHPKTSVHMARFAISYSIQNLGIRLPELRKLAKTIGINSSLARALWAYPCRETRILAFMIADPDDISTTELNQWVKTFDNWEICDQCCLNLLSKRTDAWNLIQPWIENEREFIRRTGFVLLAILAVHDHKAANTAFIQYFDAILLYSADPRNFVKKAVSWALRQIGKRNPLLHDKADEVAHKLLLRNEKTSIWIGKDVIRDLERKSLRLRNVDPSGTLENRHE